MSDLADLNQLLDFLGRPDSAEIIAADKLPAVYATLLAHSRHMTVALEEFWKSPVSVHVLHHEENTHLYTRRIVLRTPSGTNVEYGAVQINFDLCPSEVAQEIRAQPPPLGRILINHGVMTHVEPRHFLRITPSSKNIETLGLNDQATLFGRFATIAFNGQPAMTVVEIMPSGLEDSE